MRCAAFVSLLALASCVSLAPAQEVSLDGRWFAIDELPAELENATPWIRPSKGQQVLLDVEAMKETLAAAPLEFSGQAPLIIWLPKPDGSFERFGITESPIMLPDLAQQLPDVKTYAGQGIDDPYATVRFDMTPAGFHAQVLSVNGAYYIDPSTQNNIDYYTSYYKRDYRRAIDHVWRCFVGENAPQMDQPAGGFAPRVLLNLNTVRLAVAATAEFTAYHSLTTDTDTVKRTKAQTAITTLINRVNGIYEKELGTRLLLVNNTNVIYTNSTTDPYDDANVSQMIGANQTTLTSVIGSANFDVGHVVGRTGGGGVAGLGVVCSTANKGRGVSCFDPPIGDPFAVDYIAHELGHQFNGQHSFAGCNGNAGSSGWRYEPGSGSTIMAYAGICGPDNLQNNSDPFFHHENIQGMRSFITGLSCDGTLATTNNIPTLTAPGLTYVIPQQTPFALTVTTAADSDGDPLTYSWEQSDSATAATAVALSQGDTGTNPIFRARAPVTSPTRYFPALDDVIDGTRDPGEFLPQVARTLSFRATVRDNRTGGGGVAIQPSGAGAETRVTISTAAGPFTVTNPTGNPLIAGGSLFSLTWNVANSNTTPVNCANVDILLSTDGGLTFPTVVLANTPNDGAQAVTVPSVSTNTARFMVRSVGNVFFNVSPTFRINVPTPATPTAVTATPNPVCATQSLSLSATVGAGETIDWYRTSCGGTLVGTGNPL
ncbi:MAG TPA: zinc-dependent metalloprotease family protein, partial [Phycisphaerales bacterium]|nr:zinc-dependent metalloprotease family protein [Phycisphaerales bacterium]